MTVAQAVVEYLSKQYTVDSVGGQDFRERLIPGTFGIFGHGNVAGVGQALKQYQQLDPTIMPYYQGRNEQAQVAPGRRLRPPHPAPPDLRDQHLDRPGFLEPAHRRGAGHHQPAAGAAAAE